MYHHEIQRLRETIGATEIELKSLKRKLENAVRECRHAWGPVVYNPIVQEARTIEGDAPGTMGVDWRGPTHVPRQETPRWQRTCTDCGHVETTSRTTPEVKHNPVF